MVDKITFMETLRSVQEMAKASPKPLSREEIRSYFQDMELSEEQQELVYQYLHMPKENAAADKTKNTSSDMPEEQGVEQQEEERVSYSPHFQMYLEEISAVPLLSEGQERALYERLLQGEDAVIEDISGQWLKRVIKLAEACMTAEVLLEDLVQEGNIGLLLGLGEQLGKAAEYGLTKGSELTREQQEKLEQRLEEYVREGMEHYRQELEGEASSENTILAKVSLIHEARKILAEENGTDPTLQELCDYTRISPEEITDILTLHDRARRE